MFSSISSGHSLERDENVSERWKLICSCAKTEGFLKMRKKEEKKSLDTSNL